MPAVSRKIYWLKKSKNLTWNCTTIAPGWMAWASPELMASEFESEYKTLIWIPDYSNPILWTKYA